MRNLAEGKRYFEILSNIVKGREPVDYGTPLIKGAENIPINEKNFHPFPMKSSVNKRVCFVDGGNNIIYLSPGHAIHMVRLYYSIFQGKNKVEQGRYTFILNSKYDGMEYTTEIHDMDSSGIYERTIIIPESEMDEREKIRGVGSYIRRIGEWLLIEKIMNKCDILVKDGSLQTTQKGEYEYVDRIFEKNAIIAGLSKTCTILTSTGYSLVGAIHHLSLKSGIRAPWYYHPIARNIGTIRGDMFVVKLHPNSSHTFRCEISPANNPRKIFEILASLSNDPVFPGYPYGLLDADINARVSDEEIKLYRSIVYDNADKFSIIESNSMNAHDIISEVK